MSFVDPERLRRKGLPSGRVEFFLRLIPWAEFVQRQTFNKAEVEDKFTHSGVFTSVIAAHALIKSKFGEHPVSQHKHQEVLSNNLCLVVSHKFWTRSTIEYEGVTYKAYRNWRECAIDFSDILAWFAGFEDVLAAHSVEDQIHLMSSRESDPAAYRDNMAQLIAAFELKEYDWHGS